MRYFDEIGLLSPQRVAGNEYRIYSQNEVDLLQQILLFRELGVPLNEIKQSIGAKGYDRITALERHLSALKDKRNQINLLIANVEKTITASKGGIIMDNKDKFDGFKQRMVSENEEKYGKEIREKYGDEVVDASNAKVMGLTPDQYREVEELSRQISDSLRAAFALGDPSSELAQTACALHRKWLGYFWGHYSKEAHLGLSQTYVDDPRFRAYYDAIATGCAEFFRDALRIYCGADA